MFYKSLTPWFVGIELPFVPVVRVILSIYCMERQRQQDNTKPIEPGTNDCDCRYETIILISVSANNQSQATAIDSLNDKINLYSPQN